MLKKLLALTLALIICLSFAACDISQLLEGVEENADETQNIQLGDGFGSAEKIDPYTIEYEDNGDGTCKVVGITISENYSYSFSTGGIDSEKNYIIYGGEEVTSSVGQTSATIISGSGGAVITYVDGDIDIVIPEKNPDGLTVTSIEFDGFDSIVPNRIGQKAIDTVLNNEHIDEFTRQKFLAYYQYDEESSEYVLPEGLLIGDIIAISDMMLSGMALSESDIKNIFSETGEDTPNIALKVKSVTVPETVVSISDNAFAWCYNLEEYNIPEGCEYNESIFMGSQFFE